MHNMQKEAAHLQKKASTLSLIAIGVGAVISGNFFGWQFGLLSGGFIGMLIATVVIACLYLCLLGSVAELATMHPSAGGFYRYTELAFGRFIGFLCGITICIEYILVPTVVVSGIGDYLHALLPFVPTSLWWLIVYALFLTINIAGISMTLIFSTIVTLFSVIVLAFFYISSLFSGHFHWHSLFFISHHSSHHVLLSHGYFNLWFTLPFAIWLFIGIEEMPMAAEETKNVDKSMPKAIAIALVILFVLAILTVVINSGTGLNVTHIAHSSYPLLTGFLIIYGHSVANKIIFTLLCLVGLVASVHSLTYAYGRILYAMGRENNLPRYLARLNSRQAPARALLTGGIIGLLCMFVMKFSSSQLISAILLNMAVFGAVISYILVLLSYIRLRLIHDTNTTHYKSPFGIQGAVLGIILSLLTLSAILAKSDIRPGIWGVVFVLVIASIYYWIKKTSQHFFKQEF